MAAGMNTATATALPANEVSDAAAYTAGMNTSTVAALAADSLRQSTSTPNYDATHERVNEVARAIAEKALAQTGGRSTYSWEGNGIRLTYTGDTVDTQGDFAYGPTIREYLVGDEYKTTSPTPSQSGTGLLNLALDHVRDSTDPIIEAKRHITWLLLDPALDLVEYTIRTSTAWHGLMQTPHKLRTALAIRLAEVVEQKVLENPGGGLDLKDLLDGTNVVGYMVKTLDGSIFNLMKRIITNESKHRTTLDTPVDDDDAYRRPVAELATEQLPSSAEADAIEGEATRRAMAIVEVMHAQEEAVAQAKIENLAAEEAGEKKAHTVRARRAQEKSAMVAHAFLAQTELPVPVIPNFKTRNALLWDLAFEDAQHDALVTEAKKQAELRDTKPEAVLRDPGMAYYSFMAWHNLLHGESDARDAEVPDAWMTIWESYSPEDTQQMLAFITGHEDRVAKVIEGVLSVPEAMSPATKKRVRDVMKKLADHDELNDVMSDAVDAYDVYLQGGSFLDWKKSALKVLENAHAPKLGTVAELGAAFDEAVAALIH